MALLKIEKNIPRPVGRGNDSVASTLRQMEVGDSVVLTAKQVESMRNAARRLGCKVSARALSDGTFRLWLTSRTLSA